MKNQVYVYDFTIQNNGNFTLDEIKRKLNIWAKKWCFQLEKAGSEHYQGRMSLKEKMFINQVIQRMEVNWHFSPTSITNKDNEFYVMKVDTRIAGPWTDRDIEVPRQLKEIEKLRPWQQTIANDGVNWLPRKINVVYDKMGNSGKSILKMHVMCNKLGHAVIFQENYKDLMRQVMAKEARRLYIVDIPRALYGKNEDAIYGAIESIKDGHVYDDRYTWQEKVFDSPNIWVFTNTLPSAKWLSNDRWIYWQIERTNWGLVEFKAVPL
nr:MAG: replication associated protein [Cressdnaviricota sp.]